MMDDIEKLSGINLGKPPIRVRHEDLEKPGESDFVSSCPSCKHGILPVRRDQETFELLKEDFCLLCGQAFIYESLPAKKGK